MKWLSNSWTLIADLTATHLSLALPPILLSILIAVPIGLFASRTRRIGGLVLSAATLLYCIPALPLIIVVPTIFGIPLRSGSNVIIVLVLYGVALLVRTAADAFNAVPTDARMAAVAVGSSPWQLFWRVDLPLAIPVLISGIRVTTVSTVGLVTIGALVGVPSLGTLFTDGFQRGIVAEVLTGIVGVVALALLLDGVCLLVGRMLTPWARIKTAGGTK